jgi:acyl-CoA dehydrogenase
MNTPGITVEPIITLAGDHEVNQVFFDDVRVPQANRVGPENEGWTVAKYLLEFERGGGGAAARLEVALQELRAVATREDVDGTPLMRQPAFRHRVADLEIRIRALEFSELANLARMSRGESPGPGSSLAKNTSVAIDQALATLKLEAIGYYALPHANLISLHDAGNEAWVGPDHAETATARYLNTRAASVFGGSQEVQKNIIAKVGWGL